MKETKLPLRKKTAEGRESGLLHHDKKPLLNLILFLALVAICIFAIAAGRYLMSPLDVLRTLIHPDYDAQMKTVVWDIRLPRILMAVVVGAGLSVSGVSLQAMFGNPLVSSHILGVSYSAGFGAALGILLFTHFGYVQLSAILFGFVGMFLTYRLSRRKGQSSILTLVLSGIIIGSVFSALTSLVKFLADPEQKLPSITYWLMGSLAGSSWQDVVKFVPSVVLCILILWLIRWKLNVISLREEEAISIGINVKQTRMIVIVATTFITALSVAFCGVISFVGLAVPHFARMLTGNNHAHLLTSSALCGGAFMLLIDTAARSMTATEIPLSILTAIIGAPMFAILLHRTGGAWDD